MFAICSICLEFLMNEEVTVTTACCGYLFHESCLRTWMMTESFTSPSPPQCPICYDPMKPKSIVKLFFPCESDNADEDFMNIEEMSKKNEKVSEIIKKQEEMLSEIQSEMSKSRKPTAKKVKEIKLRVAEINTDAT